MTKIKFCPHCGQPISSNSKSCSVCGYNLAAYQVQLEIPTRSARPNAPENLLVDELKRPKFVRARTNKTKAQYFPQRQIVPQHHFWHQFKIILIWFLILMLGLTAGYFTGTFYFSRSRQITKLAEKIISTDPQELTKIVVDEQKQNLNNQEILPLVKLYQGSQHEKELMREKIMSAPTTGNIQIVESGRILGIYPKYRVLLKKNSFTLKTNLSEPIFAVNQHILSNSSNFQVVLLYPGKYQITCIGMAGQKQKVLKKNLFLSPFEEKLTVNFHIKIPHKSPNKLTDELQELIEQSKFW